MSVLIRGMKMPENCDVCMFSDWSNLHQTAACQICEYVPCFDDFSREHLSKRANFCPLVDIPPKHGRLIDADVVIENRFKNPISYNAFANLIKRQMTVVKAEGEE